MNRNNTWRWILVAVTLLLSLYEFYPPSLWGGSVLGRDLLTEFERRAVRRDETFNAILAQAKAMQATNSARMFGNLRDAIGTNDITRYFPFFELGNEVRPTEAILNRLQREGRGSIKLGLDLQGGTSYLVEMDTNALAAAVAELGGTGGAQEVDLALSHAVEVLRKRVDRFGVAEPVIVPAGGNRILVQLPGLAESEKEAAKQQIQKAAFLEFRLVHPNSDQLLDPRTGELISGVPEPGYVVMRRKERLPDGTEQVEAVLVRNRAERGLNGSYVRGARVNRGNLGEPIIEFELNQEGAVLFGEITRENVKRRLAIILDGELYSAPVINEPITGGRGQITGRFDARQAFELANVLNNPLRAPLSIVESREVDPTLGKDSIESGVRAAIYGIIAVCGFMLIYYLLAGVIANIALCLNVIILLGVMSYIDTTLTLPGIAGIVLTIGMAVDANVLIFERIREELASGKSLRGALESGYDKAFGTIIDSNLTTLIASIILIFMGTGPVKGFGVTLTIGIVASMFTALVFTRLMFDFLLARGWLQNLRMLHLVGNTRIDFMKVALPAAILSWALIVVGIGYGLFGRGADVLGVEFAGGSSIHLDFKPEARAELGVDRVRETVDKLGRGASQVSFQRDVASGREVLLVNLRETGGGQGADTGELVARALNAAFPSAAVKVLSVDQVGPSVSRDIQRTAVIASLIALFGILIYVAFRYEFSFAVGAVVATLHDILMTLGIYFLAGRELNATTVAALLTIIGFSINDTIVIFDRIREDLKLGVRGTFKEVMNAALNQTLSRTLITSGTTFLATLALYLFGGGVINDFAFCFLVGIITGTYSSIYVACFIVLKWHKGERPKLATGAEPTVENPMLAQS
ncbi:MAG: protein translocase subunit SecD [Limisphaerales bacterium]